MGRSVQVIVVLWMTMGVQLMVQRGMMKVLTLQFLMVMQFVMVVSLLLMPTLLMMMTTRREKWVRQSQSLTFPLRRPHLPLFRLNASRPPAASPGGSSANPACGDEVEHRSPPLGAGGGTGIAGGAAATDDDASRRGGRRKGGGGDGGS